MSFGWAIATRSEPVQTFFWNVGSPLFINVFIHIQQNDQNSKEAMWLTTTSAKSVSNIWRRESFYVCQTKKKKFPPATNPKPQHACIRNTRHVLYLTLQNRAGMHRKSSSTRQEGHRMGNEGGLYSPSSGTIFSGFFLSGHLSILWNSQGFRAPPFLSCCHRGPFVCLGHGSHGSWQKIRYNNNNNYRENISINRSEYTRGKTLILFGCATGNEVEWKKK